MIDYDVGDVVVCVDSDPKLGNGLLPVGVETGKLYRVLAMRKHPLDGWPCVVVDGNKNCVQYGMWACERFRKLPKATDQFTEQMRRLKPKAKPRVDA